MRAIFVLSWCENLYVGVQRLREEEERRKKASENANVIRSLACIDVGVTLWVSSQEEEERRRKAEAEAKAEAERRRKARQTSA